DYLCVTRSKLKDYIVSQSKEDGLIEVFDNRGQKIEIQTVDQQGESDIFLYVRSHAKALKEASINAHFSQHFEEELKNMESSLHKKGGTKKIEKVYERLGRIKERYPAANKHYKIEILSDGELATAITWKHIEATPNPTDGVYFLRSSKTELSENDIWDIYNTLTQIEATFRILKTDLNLRPVFHKSDDHSDSHIYLGVVAYMVVAAIRYQLKQSNIIHDWKNIVRIMNTQKMVVSTVKDNNDQLLMIKKCSKPLPKVLEIYQALNLKQAPFKMKKYVLPQQPLPVS
ncbi:MAG: transposase, partial [Bacteroidetes bacterium]|nr:transposase [Bacteroidota bacterium]